MTVVEKLSGTELIGDRLRDIICTKRMPVLVARKLASRAWHLAIVVGMKGANYTVRDPRAGFEEPAHGCLFGKKRPVERAWILDGDRKLPECEAPVSVRNAVFYRATKDANYSDHEMLNDMEVGEGRVREIPRFFVKDRFGNEILLEAVIAEDDVGEGKWALRRPDDLEHFAVILGRKYASPESHSARAIRDSQIVDRVQQALSQSFAAGTSMQDAFHLDVPLFGIKALVTGKKVGDRDVHILEARMSIDQKRVGTRLVERDFLKLLQRPEDLAGVVE